MDLLPNTLEHVLQWLVKEESNVSNSLISLSN